MNTDQKNRISQMRRSGQSYNQIANELGIPKDTVKTYCRRNGLAGVADEMPAVTISDNPQVRACRQCGLPVMQNPGRKEKIFCSDHCRNKWWNAHLSEVKRKAMYEYRCPNCGTTFYAYGNRNRKYCSHDCYIADRFGGAVCD